MIEMDDLNMVHGVCVTFQFVISSSLLFCLLPYSVWEFPGTFLSSVWPVLPYVVKSCSVYFIVLFKVAA